MRREVQYHWHVRELMARMGMRNSRDPRRTAPPTGNHPLRIADLPHRRSRPRTHRLKVLVALADIFKSTSETSSTYTATDARAQRPKKVVGAASEIPLMEAYVHPGEDHPVR